MDYSDNDENTSIGSANKIIADKAEEINVERAEELAAGKEEEPAVEKAEESTTEKAEEPTTDKAEEPTTEKAEEPTTEKEEEPTTDKVESISNNSTTISVDKPSNGPNNVNPRLLTTVGVVLLSALIGGGMAVGLVPFIYGNNHSTTASRPTLSDSAAITPSYDNKNNTNFPVVQIVKTVGNAVVGVSNFQLGNAVTNTNIFGGSTPFNGGNIFGGGTTPGNIFGGGTTPGIADKDSGMTEVGSGSGFIIDAQHGYIVTNKHVIEGAEKIVVNLADGKTTTAKLIGSDDRTDLAVIQIDDTKGLTAIVIGDSTKLEVGEPVVAIGDPGGQQFSHSVTTGVVSATNRILDIPGEASFNLIQTDAAINPGNSGGPLVDYLGQVIGIDSAKNQETGFEGMGFAIPISDAMPTIKQLIDKGYASHPGLNVEIDSRYTSEYATERGWPEGAYVAKVVSGGAGASAGIQAGDIITKVNDTEVKSGSELTHELFKYKANDKITISIYSEGKTKDIPVTLTEMKSA